MQTRSNIVSRIAAVFLAASLPLLAGGPAAATPEPSTIMLTALGIGAIIVVARKRRGR